MDIASLFSPKPKRASKDIRYRQGVILAWDNLTLENTIDVDGVPLEDLPVLGIGEAATYEVGDVVGLLVIGEEGAQTWAVIGQLAAPNTAPALSALSLLGAFIESASVSAIETTSSTSATDLTTPGPQVTCRIGPSGKALVFVTARIYVTTVTNGTVRRAYAGVTISGATTVAFSIVVGGAKHQETLAVGLGEVGQYTGAKLVEGLNAGDNTFKMQYVMSSPTDGGAFSDRNITVFPL